jgi:hypothetical protein
MPARATAPTELDVVLVRGAARFLVLHAAELPQKDELCGAFCALLALRAAEVGDGALDQDDVAAVAGTRVTRGGDVESLPLGEPGRRDYRLALREVGDPSRSGTTVAGLVRAVREFGDGAVTPVPLHGLWTEPTLTGLIGVAARAGRPMTLIANVATDRLWGSRCPPDSWVRYLATGTIDGPPADWDVGHFVCVLGAIRGAAGTLVIVADTYPSLGWRGIHLQPVERVVTALQRPGRPPGGMLVVAGERDLPAVRAEAQRAGLSEGVWDNGTAP